MDQLKPILSDALKRHLSMLISTGLSLINSGFYQFGVCQISLKLCLRVYLTHIEMHFKLLPSLCSMRYSC